MSTDSQTTAPRDHATFDEIRALAAELPGPDADSAAALDAQLAELAQPQPDLGTLPDILGWLARWQGRATPRLRHKRIAIYAARHGIAAAEAEALPEAAAHYDRRLARHLDGESLAARLAGDVDSDLQLHDMAAAHPTGDSRAGPAMTVAEAGRALAYGMMAVDQGIDVLGLGTMSRGAGLAAATLTAALTGTDPEGWLVPGDADPQLLPPSLIAARTAAARDALARHGSAAADPLAALTCLGGPDIAAQAGAVLAARLARVPVALDGFAALAAALVVHSLGLAAGSGSGSGSGSESESGSGLVDHCRPAQDGAEPGRDRLAAHLGLAPLGRGLALREGDGAGAALAWPLLAGACRLLDLAPAR